MSRVELGWDGDPKEPWNFPPGPAVYFIRRGGKCLYVGSTTDLRARIRGHKTERGRKLAYALVEWIADVPAKRLRSMEREYIIALKPRWNRHYVRPNRKRKARKA